jgi:hypothetical protein
MGEEWIACAHATASDTVRNPCCTRTRDEELLSVTGDPRCAGLSAMIGSSRPKNARWYHPRGRSPPHPR